ncbi:helix-turn-helix transcriptional regulator [Micromonospora sp. CPCC 206061]|uniref:helix-turn-helix transcriptional regulator n=1 Tax=Micromonospora sp. CPCC 206061 TaxID=3122410 RepID=UPI002FF38AB6
MARPADRPGNLPVAATSFVGRRRELADVRAKLAAARLVTLVGPGGVGKTRLAVRAASGLARAFPGGAWVVELAEVRDPALAVGAVVAALDLRDQASASPERLLRIYLRDKELLLVVDNCEHVLDAVAGLVDDVIRSAPGVRVLATSREPLSVAGEHVLPVPPLRLPDGTEPLTHVRHTEAVSLFAERAAAATGTFEVTAANVEAVVEVCRRLDGLPLAIELAAVRTRALSPEQIRDRLSDRFALLTGGSRTALPRQQALHTTVEWSYDLLTPDERTLLARLCVFAGRFNLDDVEAVCCFGGVPARRALDLLSSLLDKSLVMKEDVAAVACYRLHETMREYARAQLRATGEEDTTEGRCLSHYLSRCRTFAAEGRHRLVEWLRWMDVEADNVRAVLVRCRDRGDLRHAVALADALLWYWVTRATAEGVRWLDELLARTPAPPWAYFARGFLAVLQNDAAAATAALDQAVALAAGQPEVLSQSLAMASIAASMTGDRVTARRLLGEARDVAPGDLGSTLMVLQARALNGLADGDLDAARAAAAEGVRRSRAAGDRYSLGMMLMNEGFATLATGDVPGSEPRFTEGLRIAHDLDDRVAQGYLLGALGCCAAAREPRLAARLFGAMQHLRSEAGATVNAGMAPVLTRAASSVRASLGPATFDAELEAGRRLSRADAVRLALRETAPAARPPASASGVLGRREADVARLVTEGLSNKEIGARLFISERTVESHVRNILTKLGFTSRTQIAGWVAAAGH